MIFGRIGRWIAERWPISAVAYWGLHEEIPGGSRWAYVFGSSTLFLFMLQVLGFHAGSTPRTVQPSAPPAAAAMVH